MFYALLSTVYSIDVRYTLVRASESLLFFGFLLGFHYWLKDKARLDRALNIYCAIAICGVFVNIMAIVLFRDKVWCWSMPDRFQGLLGHPNIMGAFCMVSYPVLMWKYSGLNSAGKAAVGLLFCIVVGVHLMSGSRSSLAGAVFGCLIWRFILNRGADLRGWVRICTVVLVVLLCGAMLVRTKPAAFQRDDAAPITDLTDRPEFWRGCLVLAKERPILGYGFGVAGKVWSDPRFRRPGYFLWSGSAKSSLHNGYLTLLIGLGGVGVLLWLSSVVVPIRRVLFLRPSRYKALVLVICSQALLLSFFESALASYSQNYVAMLFWMCLLIAGRLPFLVSRGQDNGLAPKTAMVGAREG